MPKAPQSGATSLHIIFVAEEATNAIKGDKQPGQKGLEHARRTSTGASIPSLAIKCQPTRLEALRHCCWLKQRTTALGWQHNSSSGTAKESTRATT